MAGRSWSRKLAACAAALLSLYAVVACNAVLGIEPAELDETVGVPECPKQVRPIPPNTDCALCSEDKQGECKVSDCLQDHECRQGLRAFRNCLGAKCDDQGNTCQGCVTNKKAVTVINCLAARGCSGGAPTTVCEEYCSCMIQECPDTAPTDGTPGTPGFDACLAACQKSASPQWQQNLGDPALATTWQQPQATWRPYCLWEHCELAADPIGHSHCNHAVGKAGWCAARPQEDTEINLGCPAGKNYGGYACNHDSDCCSNNCNMDAGSCIGD